MSHAATNWAFQQRHLKAAPWRVLVMLADRHNPDYGCFPSQQRLSSDCAMSRSSINKHLATLEDSALIRRVRRADDKTHKRESTLYLFAFESGFVPADSAGPHGGEAVENETEKPCPETGHGPEKPCPVFPESHVQNLDTNPVREPVRSTPKSPTGTLPESDRKSEAEPDRELFEQTLRRFPDPEIQDRAKAMAAWRELAPNDRKQAGKRADDYIAGVRRASRRRRIPFAKYLDDRAFERVERRRQQLEPYSVAWCRRRFELLRAGPDNPDLRFMDQMLEQSRTGVLAPDDWTEPDEPFAAVRVGSAEWMAWRDAFARVGWPFVAEPRNLEFVYFPVAGPGGTVGDVEPGTDDMEDLE